MSTKAITLDMSTAQPIAGAVKLDMSTAQPIDQPGQSTQNTSQGSYTVITPQGWGTSGEESYRDTVNRAIANQRAMTPAERQRQISTAASTMPEKVPEALAGAAGIGIAGPATLAAVGEGGAALGSAVEAGINALAPSLTRGVVGMTAWAARHPIAAKIIWEGLKASMYGTAAGAGAKIAGKIIKAAPGE
jgi:hypothetical protein